MVRDARGFAVFESLLVAAFVAIVASILLPHYVQARARALDTRVAATVRQVAISEEAFFATRQTYASNVADLEGMVLGDVAITISDGNSGDLASSFRIRGTHPDAMHAYVWVSDPQPGDAHLIVDGSEPRPSAPVVPGL